MQTVTLVGAKHGNGTSTTAAALARYLAGYRAGPVELIDCADALDLAAVAGLGADLEPGRVAPIIGGPLAPMTAESLTLCAGVVPTVPGTAFRVIDAGTITNPGAAEDGPTVLVVRECYLSLRNATRSALTPTCAGLVVIEEPGRALGASDVSQVLGLPVLARIPNRASIARAVDAGVLMTRTPDPLRLGVKALARALDLIPAEVSA